MRADWVEIAAVSVASLVSLAMHVVFFRHAGGLWRDEANSLAIATLPSFGAIWNILGLDSNPLLYTLLLRAWASAGTSDTGLRVLGLLVGVALMAAMWLSARALGSRTPWLSIAMFGFNAVAIRTTDALRPYGLATVFIVLTFALVWRVLERPGPVRVALATLAAVLAVQTQYAAAWFVAGSVVAGVAVAARDKRWTTVVQVALVGAVAALTLVPYAPSLRAARAWASLVQFDYGFPAIWRFMTEALGSSAPLFVPLWIVLAVAAVAWAAVKLKRPRPASRPEQRREAEAIVYSAVALMVAAAGYLAFLHSTRFITAVWYYAPLMAMTAVALDGALGRLGGGARGETGGLSRALVAAAVVLVAIVLSWDGLSSGLRVRQTNVDLVARHLDANVRSDDLVLVSPWYVGVSFRRYYHGSARWTTLPELDDHSIHRYDLMEKLLRTPEPLEGLMSAIDSTLTTGRRLWVVGDLTLPPGGGAAPEIPVVEDGKPIDGTQHKAFQDAWTMQLGVRTQAEAATGERVEIPSPDETQRFENESLLLITGRSR